MHALERIAMNKLRALGKITVVLLCTGLLADCTLEPIQQDRDVEVIKGAPDWVNQGSKMLAIDKDTRVFRGVSSITLQGDMAMQKSLADDKAITETGSVLGKYLESVSNTYLTTAGDEDDGTVIDQQGRTMEKKASRRVKDNITSQIDSAIQRQFKQDVSPQFKEDIYRRIKDGSSRQIKESIAYQVEFSSSLEEEIAKQIKAAVSRQLLNTSGVNLSGARIIENWRDPQTNMIWSMSQLDLKYVKNIMAGSNELNVDLKQFFANNAEPIFDGMLKDKREESFFSFQ